MLSNGLLPSFGGTLERGVATHIMVVARNLGHADTRMVERHYGHLAPSYIADAIRAGAPTFGIEPGNVVPIEGRG
jgi:hypothetical protein